MSDVSQEVDEARAPLGGEAMILFILAVTGSALILTQSVIFASLREWLSDRAIAHGTIAVIHGISRDDRAHAHGYAGRFYATLSKLVSCPMCSGFWLGIAWGIGMFRPSFAVALFCYGPAGSLISALGVAAWLLIVEVRDAAAMWRYVNQPKDEDESS